jgi:hypothetical protein
MDREKEQREQAALDASNRRRSLRALLQDYMQAWIEHKTLKDPLLRSLGSIRIISNEEILRAAGFTKFEKLRKQVRKRLRGE